MKYEKPPLSFEQQADQLINRGIIADRDSLIRALQNINYYRFSGYLYPYKQPDNSFKPGTTLEKVCKHYTFDRLLRLIVMDAVERIEVSVRTQLVYALAHKTEAFGYMNPETFPGITLEEHQKFLKVIKDHWDGSREVFAEHFRTKYGGCHKYPPIWMASEIMPFGCTLTMYKGVSLETREQIAAFYGVPQPVFLSWLQTISVVRNICAHHSRLWNREMGVKPYIPKKQKYPQWHSPIPILMPARVRREKIFLQVPEIRHTLSELFENVQGEYLICKPEIEILIKAVRISPASKQKLLVLTQSPYRVFVILTIARYLLKTIAPNSKWKDRVVALLREYPEISRWSMGFPDSWQESPIWI